MIDAVLVGELMAIGAAVQGRHDGGSIDPLKREAKRVATGLLNDRLAVGSRILDVGGEEFYHEDLMAHQVSVANLPEQDMHHLTHREAFDAILAMHVLEHSPFPLYVLALLRRALVPGGLLYVAVPHPSDRICSGYGHWTVLPPVMWRQMIAAAGLTVEYQATGKMGKRVDWVEERFLCRRPRNG
jgi:SAM-dependent methyltransferase